MIRLEREKNIIFMYVHGKLDDEDYDKVLPKIKKCIEEYKQLRWYIDLEELDGWTAHTFWREISFALSNRMNLEKVAVVGGNKWHEAMAEVMELYAATHIEYFDIDQKENANAWIRSPVTEGS